MEAAEEKGAAEAVEAEKSAAAHQCIPKRLEPQNWTGLKSLGVGAPKSKIGVLEK